MPKRELSKCREWERERRERLKTCFDALAKLLPSHDPTITPSKLEILQRAAAHITELQQKNKELLLGDQNSTAIAQRDEVRRLRDRVRRLNARSEQLASLLRTAGLKVPKECLSNVQNGPNGIFKGPPRLWSGRLTREKAEVLQKQHENENKTTIESTTKSNNKRKRKRLSSISTNNKKSCNSSENTDPLALPLLKKTSLIHKPSSLTPKTSKKSSRKPYTPRSNTSTSSSAGLASRVASVLGPGTLILANGSVVPVPPPGGTPATLHRIQLVSSVAQPNISGSGSVILMSQAKTSDSTTKVGTTTTNSVKLPALRPKTASNLRQNVIAAKIAIPALPKRKILNKKKQKSSKIDENTINTSKLISDKNSTQKNKENIKISNSPAVTTNTATRATCSPTVTTNSDTETNIITKIDSPVNSSHQKETEENVKNNVTINNKSADAVKCDTDIQTENKTYANVTNDCQNVQKESAALPSALESCDIQNNSELTKKFPEKITDLKMAAQSESTEKINEPEIQKGGILETENVQLMNHDHSELSNDLFASLGGPGDSSGVIGGQHTESMSPTAAFLLAFPLVSTLTGGSRISDAQNAISGSGTNSSLLNNSNNNNTERNEQNNNSEDDRQSTPTTLLQIGGTMNLETNKNNNNRNVIEIRDNISVNSKNNQNILQQINDTINLDNSKESRNVLQQISDDTTVKQSRNELSNENPRLFENFSYFRESQSFSNQQNTSNTSQNTIASTPNHENPLISSVLQVSHACLYEQRNSQQSSTNFYPHSYTTDFRTGNDVNNVQNHSQNHNTGNANYSDSCQTAQTKENNKTHGNLTNNTSKNRIKHQNQRPPVNWMTSPDIKTNFSTNEHSTTATTSDYFLPPFSDVYSGISGGISGSISSDLIHQNNNNDQAFGSWNSAGNRSVLPTLLGDLALGVTSVTNSSNIYTNSSTVSTKDVTVSSNSNHNQYYQPYDSNLHSNVTSSVIGQHSNVSSSVIGAHSNVSSSVIGAHSNVPNSVIGPHSNVPSSVIGPHSNVPSSVIASHSNVTESPLSNLTQLQTAQNQLQQQNKESSGSFLSVSSILVGQKSRKNHVQSSANQNATKKHRDRSNKSRTNTNNDSNNQSAIGFVNNEVSNTNKKYSGGYSAEELIADSQFEKSSNISSYNLINPTNLGPMGAEVPPQQLYQHRGQNIPPNHQQMIHQTNQQQQQSSRHQGHNQGYQVHGSHRQQTQQQQQGPFGTGYPALTPNHGEISALLSAVVVDSYNKSFDSFVHVKPPSGAPMGPVPSTGFDSYCSGARNDSGNVHHSLRSHSTLGSSETDRRRHSRRSGVTATPRDNLTANIANTSAVNAGGSFSELSFLSMTGAVNSPILQDDFHTSATFLTNAPPPIPTPVASSLTNFNLSAIFPEINKGAPTSTASAAPVWPHTKPPTSSSRTQTRYQLQNQQNPNHQLQQHGSVSGAAKTPGGYCHPQQHPHGQQLPHETLYGGSTTAQSYSSILGHHQVQNVGTGSNMDVSVAPTSFSFSFTTP